MSAAKLRLAFISPIFLFPADAGGKIRTGNILRGLKGGKFHVTLLSPAAPGQTERFASDIAGISDHYVPWHALHKPKWRRAFDLLGTLPVNVAADSSATAIEAVQAAADADFDLIVFDFVHAAVLLPASLKCACVCFTHNVEAEIFARHAETAGHAMMRALWRSQHAKMLRYEGAALRRFDSVIAVSERDARMFADYYSVKRAFPIPTGVDLDFFSWVEPAPIDQDHPPTVVFTGSMDSAANIGGVRFFIESVWPLIRAQRPDTRLLMVGRNPPATLAALARDGTGIAFTGSVDDVRPYVRGSHVFVIPLLVGGGTRIKAFEAMAMGCPVVSTTLGVEGLDVQEGVHYVRRDEPGPMAQAINALLADPAARLELSRNARGLVEAHFGHAVAAQVFEQICVDAVRFHQAKSAG